MYFVVNIIKSNENIVVPFNWIQQIRLGEISNNGPNASIVYKIFYSSDLSEIPDFNAVEIESVCNGQRGCYKARLLWFFDEYERALTYAEHRRKIAPKTYCERKLKSVIKIEQKDSIDINYEMAVDEPLNESKQAVHDAIAGKMRAMNELTFDLTDSEIEDFQEIIASNSDDEADFDDTDTFFVGDNNLATEMNDTAVFTEGQAMSQDPTVDGIQKNGFCPNLQQVLSPIPEHSEADRSDVTVESIPENAEMPVPSNGCKIDPTVFEEGIKKSAAAIEDCVNVTVEIIPEDAEMPVPFNGSKIDPDVFKKGEIFLEKSIECEKQISSPSVCGNSQKENVAGDRNINCMPSEVDFVSKNITSHIPPNYECVYDPIERKFVISTIGVKLKISLLKLIICWNSTSPFSSIIYDARFIHLLLVGIIGTQGLASGKYDKHLMRFIRDVFIMRVGPDSTRAIRFGGYVSAKQDKIKAQFSGSSEANEN